MESSIAESVTAGSVAVRSMFCLKTNSHVNLHDCLGRPQAQIHYMFLLVPVAQCRQHSRPSEGSSECAVLCLSALSHFALARFQVFEVRM